MGGKPVVHAKMCACKRVALPPSKFAKVSVVKTPEDFQMLSSALSSRMDVLGNSTTNNVGMFVRQGSERKGGGGGVHWEDRRSGTSHSNTHTQTYRTPSVTWRIPIDHCHQTLGLKDVHL